MREWTKYFWNSDALNGSDPFFYLYPRINLINSKRGSLKIHYEINVYKEELKNTCPETI